MFVVITRNCSCYYHTEKKYFYYTKRVKCIFEYYFNSFLKKEGEEMAQYDPFIFNKNKNREAAMLRYMSATIDIKLFSHNMSGRVAVSYLIFLYSEISFLFSFYFISFFFSVQQTKYKSANNSVCCQNRTFPWMRRIYIYITFY